ncbi:CocE/NonD family hydrolase [Saccharopolyspora sp. K220]|uniref:CocE/NonD family hydrolase n=1 Tax=Saccharopolyspora soli TaxID=2926618 RepID=UPI001F5995A2|nr:CocE/NonD family hydrolase [Saccharopolyspora soli]MCI2421730.1 CocE/NonD family hydrolase [Saccharopolyspora soli]
MTAVLLVFLLAASAQAEPGCTVRSQTIPGADGVPLDAKVVEPRGNGPFPVLVMPASWSMSSEEYVGAAAKLAYQSGYVVVSYTARGFHGSGGEVEVAGPADVADASAVIDWALENTASDPERVGMAGVSYGAGISVLTAAADPRVRAVSAMSGWADLVASLYPNRTVSSQGAELLLASGHLTGRFGDDLRELERAYRAGHAEDGLGMAPVRSPLTHVDELNGNGTAVLIANAWEDSLFPPRQMVDLYRGLRGPKRLMFSPGDHATPELFGAAGMPNDIWESTARWFDRYLRGVDNGIDVESPVQLKPVNGGTWRGYPDLPMTTVDTRYLQADGSMGSAPVEWSREIAAGVPTVADSGAVMVNGTLQGFNVPTGVLLPLVDRRAAGVWTSQPYRTAVTVNGAARLRTTITPSSPDTSVFAYLCDVDPSGAASLITYKPFTVRDAAPGRPVELDLGLEPTLWQVPAGHRIGLVVDTVDPRYQGRSSLGSNLVFDSTASAPSTVEIPVE